MFARSLILFSLIGWVAACGPAEDENGNPNIIPGNNPTNNGTTGTNNTTTGTNNNTIAPEVCEPECGEGFRCLNGACVDEAFLSICTDPEDLGVVDMTMTHTGTGNTSFYADTITSSCGFDEVLSAPEYAVRFQVDEPGIARFSFTTEVAVEWLIEVRQSCPDPVEGALCTSQMSADFAVMPGEEYWAIMQPASTLDVGEVNWTLEFETLICTPGAATCDGDSLLVCDQGEREETFVCGTGCANDQCDGDTCATAFEVTAPMTLTGSLRGYNSELDFASNGSCMNTDSPGPEIVLSLPGLTAGQTVTVDASMMDSNNNSIFVVSECSDTADCIANNDFGDMLEWTVEADGDYFVVIDTIGGTDDYMYAIDIQ